MLRSAVSCLGGMLLLCLLSHDARAGQIIGILELPEGFTPSEEPGGTGYWRGLRNEVLPVLPPLQEPRTEMVVTLGGGGLRPLPMESPPLVKMEDSAFVPKVLPVHAGTQVVFENNDSTFHFLEPVGTKKFMPPIRIATRATARHTFTKPGEYVVRCSEVPHMRTTIFVLAAPMYSLSDEAGNFRFPAVPDGTYVLKVWYRGKWVYEQPVGVKGKTTLKVQLPGTLGKD